MEGARAGGATRALVPMVAIRHRDSSSGVRSNLIVGRAFGLGVAGFFFEGDLAEPVVDPGHQLPEAIDLAILLQNDSVERFEIVLQVQTEALEGDQASFKRFGVGHRGGINKQGTVRG